MSSVVIVQLLICVLTTLCVQGMEQENDSRSGSDVVRENIEARARICTKFYWFVIFVIVTVSFFTQIRARCLQ